MTTELEIVKEFKCAAGDCPGTCCKGWQIPVDERTIHAYQSLKHLSGFLKRAFIIQREPARIRRLFGRCPFFTKDGLCAHQCKGQPELMPIVCRIYPRRSLTFGEDTEVTLELSCPAAASLFLSRPGRLSFVPRDESIEPLWLMENDAPDFFTFLKRERQKLLDYLWEEPYRALGDCFQNLYAYVYRVHQLIVGDHLSFPDGPIDFSITDKKEDQGAYALYKEKSLAFFSLQTLDRMLLEHIDYGNLMLRMPRLYKMLKQYKKRFSKMTIRDADAYFHDMIGKMGEIDASYPLLFRSYFSYNLQQLFCNAYETYFILREYLLALLYTQFLMLFYLIEYCEVGDVTPKRRVEILTDCEHAIRHNPSLTQNLYSVIRDEFL